VPSLKNAAVTLLLLALTTLAPSVARAQAQPACKVGMAERSFAPAGDFDWRGSLKRTIKVTIWYPTDGGAKEISIETPANDPLWHVGTAAIDAPPASSKKPLPLIVLSHGTGSAGVQLGWLGTALARHGFVAAAVNHPGNSYEDTSTFEGFVLRWQRARDLGVAIDGMLADKTFGPRIDSNRIGAAGFSLGGFTVLEIAGARTDLGGFYRYCASHQKECVPPDGYANLLEQIETKSRTDAAFRAALSRAGDSYRDERVRAVFAMAPPLARSLGQSSLASITIPVRIVVGDADRMAPAAENAAYDAKHIRGARLDVLQGGIGHFVFLDTPTAKGRAARSPYALDPPGVDRDAIHARVSDMAIEFFVESLK
jgi:predicted dienelactone hydrolase